MAGMAASAAKKSRRSLDGEDLPCYNFDRHNFAKGKFSEIQGRANGSSRAVWSRLKTFQNLLPDLVLRALRGGFYGGACGAINIFLRFLLCRVSSSILGKFIEGPLLDNCISLPWPNQLT